MADKEKIIANLQKILNSLDITSDFRLVLIQTIEYLQEEPVWEDLEEAAYYNCIDRLSKESIEDFKAGAKWQKEQMLAKAIDAHCFGFQDAALFSFRLPADNYLVGSEVKVIVIKED